MSAISVAGVVRTFPVRPPVAALAGVDLQVPEGHLVAVLGPSGCGKTTLLRAIAGLERPDAGSIRIGETVVDADDVHVPPHRRSVGLVPQEGALFPHLDVAGNVSFGLARQGRSERTRRTAELLELIGLPDLGRRRPHELSGGQQQRIALARALAPEPAVVLLDEPFSALDTGLRSALRREVSSLLRRQGTTAMLVTHDQTEALTMADTVAVMRGGEIVQQGTPDEVYRRPLDAWVGAFVGDAVRVDGRRRGEDEVDGPLGPARLAHDFAHHDAVEVSVFVRPEQIRLAPPGSPPERTAAARVLDARFQGPEILVDLAVGEDGGEVVTARWPSTSPVPVGSAVRVVVEGPVLAHARTAPASDGGGLPRGAAPPPPTPD